VEQALKRLGANLRTARLRRNLTLRAVAEKIGTGARAVS
jgi:transcriptional regulator with XRE-family HTH domain